ncbi:MAG: quinone oxidoreductase [Sphingomonadales bacterium]|nr:quinone oxidoreductase [Sphingomonadales bacterium]
MVQSICFHRPGGIEVLTMQQGDPGRPGRGEVRVRQRRAGINFVDVYHRTGLYPVPSYPATPGVEAVGIVEAIGEGVTGLAVGQRVAWAGLPMGGYTQARIIPAARLLPVPDAVPDRLISGTMLRGLTAHMLLHRVHAVKPADRILVTAAAGGLGTMIVRWAKRLGAEVIGVTGREAKAELARAAGADHVIVHGRTAIPAAVHAMTDGQGADVVFDGVGGDLLLDCLDCVRPFGLVASLGQASGWLPDIALGELGPRRSIAIARPSVFRYAADPETYHAAAAAYFEALSKGLSIDEGPIFPLSHAAEAHRALEEGRTTGAVVLDLD